MCGVGVVGFGFFFFLMSLSVKRNISEDSEDVMEELT